MRINIDNEDNFIIEDLKDNVSVKSSNKMNEKQHLQITRGNKVNLPTLLDGELALVKDEGKVYVGNDNENIALAKDIEVQEVSQNLNQLKTNYFGKEFNTPQERFLNEFEYIHMSGERGSFLPFSSNKSHKIQESIEGKTRGMILEGETLQNLYGTSINEFRITNTELISYKDNKFKIQANGTYLDSFFLSKNLLKPNTKYTIICDVYKNTLNQDGRFHINIDYQNKSSFIEKFEIQNFGVGRIKKVLTSKSDLSITEVALRSQLENTCTSGEIEYSIIILEGDWTNKEVPKYFEGIKSIGQEENKISILSTGKNLCPINTHSAIVKKVNDSFNQLNTIIVQNIKIDKNKQYKFKFKSSNPQYTNIKIFLHNEKIAVYNNHADLYTNLVSENKGIEQVWQNSISGYEYLSISTGGSFTNTIATIGEEIILTDIQLEEGTQTTSYEIYKENKKDILIPFADGLKSVGNTKDEINSINNKAVQKIGKYIFTGDENFYNWRKIEDRSFIAYAIQYSNFTGNIPKRNSEVICDRFSEVKLPTDIYDCLMEGIKIIYPNQSTGDIISFGIEKNKAPTVQKFKELLKKWYSENKPLTIYYELETPIEYDLTQDLNLNTYKDLTYITTEATSTFSAPVTISNTIARLNRENKTLEEENVKLKEETKNLTVENEYQQIDIDNNQLATVEIFEMIIGTVGVNNNQKINNYKIGGITMVEVYVSLIIKGKKKIEDVPAIIRTQVETMLRELGVVE